jgi:hypothetical protein
LSSASATKPKPLRLRLRIGKETKDSSKAGVTPEHETTKPSKSNSKSHTRKDRPLGKAPAKRIQPTPEHIAEQPSVIEEESSEISDAEIQVTSSQAAVTRKDRPLRKLPAKHIQPIPD